MNIKKLAAMPYAQAFVKECPNGRKILISYRTQVADISFDGWLTIYGLYSQTTRRHIGAFMREIGLTYQMAKELYNRHLSMNIYTGEVYDILQG